MPPFYILAFVFVVVVHSGFAGDPIWNVDCGGGLACNNENPICCPNKQDPYCVEAGQYCCSNTETGCAVGTTCCPSLDEGATCCTHNQTCEISSSLTSFTSVCKDDPCRDWTDMDTCLNATKKCGWCCDTNTCQSAQNLCDAVQWQSWRSKNAKCPDRCNQHSSCETCRRTTGCGWCCAQGLCSTQQEVGKNTGNGCSPMSWVPNLQPGEEPKLHCEACEEGGDGLYHTQSLLMLIMFCILLPAMCICVVVVVFFKRFCARLARRVDLLDDGSESTEPLLDPPGSASSTGKKVLKYGFDESIEKKTNETGSTDCGRTTPGSSHGEDNACALCMARKADIVFLPCYHCYCCSQCSVSLEKHRKKDGILCPFCRQPVDCMVNLAKVYKLNPHQRKRASNNNDDEGPSSSSTTVTIKEQANKQEVGDAPLPLITEGVTEAHAIEEEEEEEEGEEEVEERSTAPSPTIN